MLHEAKLTVDTPFGDEPALDLSIVLLRKGGNLAMTTKAKEV